MARPHAAAQHVAGVLLWPVGPAADQPLVARPRHPRHEHAAGCRGECRPSPLCRAAVQGCSGRGRRMHVSRIGLARASRGRSWRAVWAGGASACERGAPAPTAPRVRPATTAERGARLPLGLRRLRVPVGPGLRLLRAPVQLLAAQQPLAARAGAGQALRLLHLGPGGCSGGWLRGRVCEGLGCGCASSGGASRARRRRDTAAAPARARRSPCGLALPHPLRSRRNRPATGTATGARLATWARRARAAPAATRACQRTHASASTRCPTRGPPPCGSSSPSSELGAAGRRPARCARCGRRHAVGAPRLARGRQAAGTRRLCRCCLASLRAHPPLAHPHARPPRPARSPCAVQSAPCTSSAQCCQEQGLKCVASVCAAPPNRPGFSGNAPQVGGVGGCVNMAGTPSIGRAAKWAVVVWVWGCRVVWVLCGCGAAGRASLHGTQTSRVAAAGHAPPLPPPPPPPAPQWWDPNLTLQLDLTEPTNDGGAGGWGWVRLGGWAPRVGATRAAAPSSAAARRRSGRCRTRVVVAPPAHPATHPPLCVRSRHSVPRDGAVGLGGGRQDH